MFHLFSNSIDVLEILGQGGMRFERVSNLIQTINYYYVKEKKHDLTLQTCSMF
jgi:hypothetical protein